MTDHRRPHTLMPDIDNPARRQLMQLGVAALLTAAASKVQAQVQVQAGPSQPPPLAVFAKSPFFNQISLSPNGKQLAYVIQKSDAKYLALLDLAAASETPVYHAIGDGKVRSLFWVDDNHVIIRDSKPDGLLGFAGFQEFDIANCVDIRTNSFFTLFDVEHDFYRVVFGRIDRVNIQGNRGVIACGFRRLGDGSFSLYHFGCDDPKGDEICKFLPNSLQDWVVTPAER